MPKVLSNQSAIVADVRNPRHKNLGAFGVALQASAREAASNMGVKK